MTSHDLPALTPELENLLAAERELPSLPPGLEERVFRGVCAALGWTVGGVGGAGLAKLLGAIALLAGLVGVGYLATGRGGGAEGPPRGAGSRSAPAASPAPAPAGPPAWLGDPRREDRRIAGVVTFDGAPVAGATVVLASDATRAGRDEPDERVTGADGRFDFGPRRAATWDVTATAPGLGDGHLRVETIDPTAAPPPDALEVRLPGCAHVLHGTVRDVSGGVIVGAEIVRARGRGHDTSAIGAGTRSGPEGRFELCIPPGPVTAIVRAHGYGSVAIDDAVVGRRARDVALVPEAIVVGRVVRAEDGAPVADALVWLQPAAYPDRQRTTTECAVTDARGQFRIPGVAPGRHRVFAQTADRWSRHAPVVVEAAAESEEIVLRLEPIGAVVRGQVVARGAPVPGARVVAIADGWFGGRPANRDGRFEIFLPRPGPIELSVVDHELTGPSHHDAPAGEGAPITLEVAVLGEIRGQVTFRGEPAPDAEVVASSAAHRGARVPVDARGAFALRGLPAGRYELSAVSHGAQAFRADPIGVVLGAGEIRDGVLVELDGAGVIEGTVLDQRDRPVAAASVEYHRGETGDRCRAWTDDAGRFACGMLAGGGRYLPVVRPDAASAIAFAPASTGGLAAVDLPDGAARRPGQLLRVRVDRARITGRAVDAAGAARPDVIVRAIEDTTGYSPDTAPWLGVHTTTTDASGRFALDVLEDARYTLHARAPGGGEAALAGVVAGATGVELVLDEPGRIRGELAGFPVTPRVLARRLGNTVDLVDARVDGDGFTIDGLAPGRYAVLAVGGAAGAGETVEVHAGRETRLTLAPRPAARLTVTVTDFATGAVVAGVRCVVAAYVQDAGVAGWGTPAPPTDARGRFTIEAPSGEVEVTCAPRARRHGEGAARVTVAPGADAALAVHVVVSDRDLATSNGIGARLLLGQDRAGGYTHTLVELRPGGAAERAGLRVGDAITAVDGRPIASLTDDGLALLFGTYPVGARVRLTRPSGVVTTTIEGPWAP